ncbi:hypothetical protein [Polynucleobacter sp. AP-Kolm-20A-A1]|uniref:hypothetical protein n=1 Tax=Polynucleobacter sp. AP-Kolm-20A-A1 TaxID=2081041 RepID=UPI001BFD60F7|nr:hypothetical protein [Polynucleobacter sp. AP-Kolm-20A-A1]QWE19965.1 hypothetical protein C2745_06035 [Polynucleobacter sp. AP-Kolm-20A-A1]
MANDYLSLFIADINRAYEGMAWSIETNPPALTQAGLHARDLADALGSVGLSQLSALTDDVSRQLSLEQSSVLPIAQNLVELLKRALFALEQSDDMVMSAAHVEEIQRLSTDMLALLGGASFQSPQMQSMVDEWGMPEQQAATESEAPAADIEATTSTQTSDPALTSSSLNSAVIDPREFVPAASVIAQRRMGLNLVQRIRQMLSAQNLPANKPIDFLLSEHQDALSALGQLTLANALTDLATEMVVDGVFADADVVDTLVSAISVLPKAQRLVANKQALTLFVDLYGVQLDQANLQLAGEIIAKAQGRIGQEHDRLRITMPASLKRMRFLPFKRGSDYYVVSWAQLLSISNLDGQFAASDALGSAVGCDKVLRLSSGCTHEVLHANEVFPIVNMNSFALPSVLSGPYWMKGIALDDASSPYSWVAV